MTNQERKLSSEVDTFITNASKMRSIIGDMHKKEVEKELVFIEDFIYASFELKPVGYELYTNGVQFVLLNTIKLRQINTALLDAIKEVENETN